MTERVEGEMKVPAVKMKSLFLTNGKWKPTTGVMMQVR